MRATSVAIYRVGCYVSVHDTNFLILYTRIDLKPSANPMYLKMQTNVSGLLDAQKVHYFLQSQIFAHICEFSFLRISRKVKVLELRVVLSANINMYLPVILS